jgi:hypothetical protein
MYEAVDEFIQCVWRGQHGQRVRAAIHLFVENGDINNPEHSWMVCLECAKDMDRDPVYKATKRAAFEEYLRDIREVLKEKNRDKPDQEPQ